MAFTFLPSLSCISLGTAGSVGYYESNSGPHKAVYALTLIEAFRIWFRILSFRWQGSLPKRIKGKAGREGECQKGRAAWQKPRTCRNGTQRGRQPTAMGGLIPGREEIWQEHSGRLQLWEGGKWGRGHAGRIWEATQNHVPPTRPPWEVREPRLRAHTYLTWNGAKSQPRLCREWTLVDVRRLAGKMEKVS